jgi:hypothetical protein
VILKNYDEPNEEELEAAFREIYYFVQGFTRLEKILVWLILRRTGDRLFRRVAQKMHQRTMQTLNHASVGMHKDFFRRKRQEREAIRRESRGFVRATIVE